MRERGGGDVRKEKAEGEEKRKIEGEGRREGR